MKTVVALLLLHAMFGSFSASLAVAQGRKIPASKLPLEIRKAVSARFPDTPIAGAVQKTQDGKTLYEVTLRIGGKNIDVTASRAGALTFIERELNRSQVPAGVAQTLERKYPKASWKMIEDVSTVTAKGATRSYYEVLLTDSRNQDWEVQVALDGFTILKEERKKAGEQN